MSIVLVDDLEPDAVLVQERAVYAAKHDIQRLTAKYRELFGKHVGTDFARELFPEYAESIENKLKYATAVQRSAACVADAVFKQILEESNGGSALFTAGGTGAGKTVSIKRHEAGQCIEMATVIFDSNFNSFDSYRKRVEMALENGCKVIVIFVHRHPVESYIQGVLPRALEQGRTVPIESHLRIHRDARKTFLKMHNSFVNNEKVSFTVLSNTGHESEAFPADIDYLKAVKYDEKALEKAIREGLDYAYNQKTITQTLYDSSRGSPQRA